MKNLFYILAGQSVVISFLIAGFATMLSGIHTTKDLISLFVQKTKNQNDIKKKKDSLMLNWALECHALARPTFTFMSPLVNLWRS
jgi:molecular chaperone DnaK (HSP70)